MKLDEIATLNNMRRKEEARQLAQSQQVFSPNIEITAIRKVAPQMADMLCKLKKMRDDGVSEEFLDSVDLNIDKAYGWSDKSKSMVMCEAVIKAVCEELENDE